MPPDNDRDYEVGYGKPPRRTRFKKGQSGNPRGRLPGAKNLKTLLSEALNEFVIVTENGGRRKITKRQAIITQLVNRSATADLARDQDPARYGSGHRGPDRAGFLPRPPPSARRTRRSSSSSRRASRNAENRCSKT